jgi:SAM-dependent methyltransferase
MSLIPNNVMLENTNCPNGCNSTDKLVFNGKDILHDLPGNFNVVKCLQCGLQRTSPRPTPETIGFYYPENYAPYKSTKFQEIEKNGFKGFVLKILRFQTRILPNIKAGRMLEIGCSSGSYMEYARSKGWMVDGIEFSSNAAKDAIAKGFNVQIGAVENSSPPNVPYDIIVGWMVFEHLHNPNLVLNKFKQWIKPDGYIILLVPDVGTIFRSFFKDLSFDSQLPTHLYHFTPKSIKTFLGNNGYKVVNIRYQRNCITLVRTLMLWAKKHKKNEMYSFLDNFLNNSKFIFLRLILSFFLGFFHQSGRMEVMAKLK